MEVSLGQLVPAVLAGALGSAGAWFTLARSLVTRAEVEKMIQARIDALHEHQTRQERLIDDMRAELVAVKGEMIRLGVLLSIDRARDTDVKAGADTARGN